MSSNRLNQLRDLQNIIEEVSRAIMWVNGKEEEELMFDWGDKNIDQYIPRKQESYSVRISNWVFFIVIIIDICCKFICIVYGGTVLDFIFVFIQQKLMSDLEEKEKELNRLKIKSGALLNSNHPAKDKIEVTVVGIWTVFW